MLKHTGLSRRLCLGMAVVLAGAMAYAGSLRAPFVFDDGRVLARLQARAEWPLGIIPLTQRPVTDFTFALNHLAGGTNPAGYHVGNVVLHLFNAWLLYELLRWILRRRTVSRPDDVDSDWIAAVAAAVWVCHPLTTHAVTYIAQRYEALASGFYLLTLYAAARGLTGPAGRATANWRWVAVVACGMGMGAKEIMITAPVAVLLFDFVFVARGQWRDVGRRWLFHGALASAWVLLALFMRLKLESDQSAYYAWQGSSPLGYAWLQARVLWRYLRLAIVPYPLCFDYGWTWPPAEAAWVRWACVAGLGVIGTAGLLGTWRGKGWGWAILLPFVVLAPTSSVIPRPDAINEYRMYLPLAALCGLGAWGVAAGVRRWVDPGRVQRILAALGLAVLCVCVHLTVRRNADYRSEERLWRSTLEVCPGNLRARLGLGAALLKEGRHAESRRTLEEVVRRAGEDQHLPAPQKKTLLALTMNDLGVIAYRERDYQQAAECFRRALEHVPSLPDARGNLDRALRKASAAGHSGQ